MGDWEGIEKPIVATTMRFSPGQHAKYVANHRSFGAFMRSSQMRDVTHKVAKDIAIMARELSPVSQRGGDQDGLRMRDQFKVERGTGFMKVSGNIRVMVEVVNEARSAAPNEFGTRRNKRHRMLGRAGAHFGDFKPEGGPGGGS